LARPDRGHGIMPVVDTAAIVLALHVTNRQIEFDQARVAVRQHPRANFTPELGEIGFLLALARNEDEIGGVDGTDGRNRELLGGPATDADQRYREHDGSGGERSSDRPRRNQAALCRRGVTRTPSSTPRSDFASASTPRSTSG